MKKNIKQLAFFKGIRDELVNVSWPTRSQTIYFTLAVFILSLLVGLYVGVIDIALARALEIITKL